MNWDAIGAVGVMIGALAVVVTLAYLAMQVRHAQGEVQRNVSQSRTDAARDFNLASALNDRFSAINAKAHENMGGRPNPAVSAIMEQAGLTFEEATTFTGVQLARWQMQTQIFNNIAELSKGQRVEFDNLVRRSYDGSLPASQLWYSRSKGVLNPELVDYIDDLLARSG